MATIDDLFKLQKQIKATEKKLDTQKKKRCDLIKNLGLKYPGWSERKAENFISVDGKINRLWLDCSGDFTLEAIEV